MAGFHRSGSSSLGIKHEGNKQSIIKSADRWLEDKRKFDGAENLWRIHDCLYDMTEFIDKHPGGKFWIETTKGLDITETWESHHISSKPEHLLPKYFVRKAKVPRNSPFTFHEDGFYKTLKRNARPVLATLPKHVSSTSNYVFDVLFVASFVLTATATFYSSYLIGFAAGICMGFALLVGHNFYHQLDNFRIYYNDIFMLSSRDFRIVHVLSHHPFPNSVSDMQAYLVEPIVLLFPGRKCFITKYLSYIYVPFLVWPTLFLSVHCVKLYEWIVLGNSDHIEKTLLAWILPLFVYVLTKQPLLHVMTMWIFVMLNTGLWFSFIGFATNHYHPDIFMDGDKPRENERDWGVFQLDTAGDKTDVVNTNILGLLFFGDHALHHLFPALDHSVIQHLYPVFRETLRTFNLELRVMGKGEIVGGYFWRLSKEAANPLPPAL
ncbi:hypothetical protein RI129_012249 [Pyrocoelia pectoralis]|uniref:Cytochrome b5-related protein n=1 Tax=Pyrocoelia pectoralis TaxID=417401 RepID=A0AAN7V6Y4_9COLE